VGGGEPAGQGGEHSRTAAGIPAVTVVDYIVCVIQRGGGVAAHQRTPAVSANVGLGGRGQDQQQQSALAEDLGCVCVGGGVAEY
jgi:hypothetical protein